MSKWVLAQGGGRCWARRVPPSHPNEHYARTLCCVMLRGAPAPRSSVTYSLFVCKYNVIYIKGAQKFLPENTIAAPMCPSSPPSPPTNGPQGGKRSLKFSALAFFMDENFILLVYLTPFPVHFSGKWFIILLKPKNSPVGHRPTQNSSVGHT